MKPSAVAALPVAVSGPELSQCPGGTTCQVGRSAPHLEAQGDPAAVNIQSSLSFTEEEAGILQYSSLSAVSGLTPPAHVLLHRHVPSDQSDQKCLQGTQQRQGSGCDLLLVSCIAAE